MPPGERAARLFRAVGFKELPSLSPHVIAIESLPPFHTDPFDRLLLAQALSEPLRLVTHDRTVASYDNSIQFV